MKPNLFSLAGLALVAAVPFGAMSGQAQAVTYAVDIDSTFGGTLIDTAPGFTSLDATAGEGSSVTINGVTFTVNSADGSRNRGGAPNSLTTDFVFDDGAGQAVGLLIDNLPTGRYLAEVWSFDTIGGIDPQQILRRQTGGAEVTITNNATADAVNPVVSFELVSDGVTQEAIFARELNTNNRSRLNGLRLTKIETPAAFSLIQNGGFEDPALPSADGFTDTNPTGWISVNDNNSTKRVGIIGELRAEVPNTPDGTQLLLVQDNNVGAAAQVGQRIGDLSLLGLDIDVNYLVSRRANESTATGHLLQLIAGSDTTFAGGTVLDTFAYDTALSAAGRFNYVEATLSALGNVGTNTDLWLVFTHDLGGSGQLLFDQVSATIHIPEPATAALGLMGLAGLMMRRRRVA